MKKFQTFLINVIVLEGRHYIWSNMDSMVMVKVHDRKKYTAVKPNTDIPYYNEHFVFEFSTTLEDLIDMKITLTVIKPGGILRKRQTLGYIMLDVGTVWYQQDHQFYHKWAILSAPREDYVGGTRGYLKVDVCILAKGETLKIPKSFNTDDIETNLLLSCRHNADRQRINFLVDIYRGLDFLKKHLLQDNAKKAENPSAVSVEVSFSGLKAKTTSKKNTSSPEWNERLTLPELFPPLCQRFKVELYQGSSRKAVRFLNLCDIADDREEGFLPTFGPAYLHFYSPNHLEGYLGKVLMSLETKWIGNALEHEPERAVQEAPHVDEKTMPNHEAVFLFAAIFDASLIGSRYGDKPVSFRMACGSCHRDVDDGGERFSSTVTPPVKPVHINKNYSYLPIENAKPCLDLTLSLPDVRKNMYNYNLLNRILGEFKSRLDMIEDVFTKKDYQVASVETETLILETLDYVSTSAGKYIDIVSGYNLDDHPLLDRQRHKMCLKEMEKIVFMVKSISTFTSKRKIFQKLEKLYTALESLADNVESWPLVYLWMISGNKRVAYHVIRPESIVHSVVEEERGVHSGLLQTVHFRTEESSDNAPDFASSVCQMNVLLWMGLARHWDAFLPGLPSGFTLSPKTVPRTLMAEERHEFQGRAHVFQGRLTPGSDRSGLCDPYVQVYFQRQCKQTEVLKKSLSPVWDQTLYFNRIVIYGAKEFIMRNPPEVMLEVHDKDEFWKSELVGRCTSKALVKMADETYSPPRFPPRLAPHTVHCRTNATAEVLAAVELLEQGSEDVPENDHVLRRIPLGIKPVLTGHRIEVVFWGVREQRPAQTKHLTKPKVTVECANLALHSDIISNAKKNPNFPNPVKVLDVVLPEQREYAPALSIKLFDCRNFGMTVFQGTHVVPVETFLYSSMERTEREKRILERTNLSAGALLSSSVSNFLDSFEEAGKAKQKREEERKRKKKNERRKFCLFGRRVEEEKWSTFFELDPLSEDEDFNWWTKFYASLEHMTPEDRSLPCNKYRLKIYRSELESQPEFSAFSDLLQSFPLYKGKRTGDEALDEENTAGVFKGSVRVYRWPPPGPDHVTVSGQPLEGGTFRDFPPNGPLRFVVRAYCVRALGLRPKDVGGKSDPYLRLTLGGRTLDTRDAPVKGQLNPVFGRCFELSGAFPQDHALDVAVLDWDAASGDDLIGQTRIDIENRFYTRHRAHCGLAEDYVATGHCQWRDQQKPTVILENLCMKYNIPEPEYLATSVTVACKQFAPEKFAVSDNIEYDRQVLALAALRRWQEIPVVGCCLVPEHVETRSLYNSKRPGIEQGKLQLWIDILPCTDLPTPQAVNIVPRKPMAYELRVIVWNVENVMLDEDDYFTGEKKSDIFVKGWLANPENSQYTDVHYRSLSGEGNFNWRFIFPFEYLSNENKIVIMEKSIFALEPIQSKIPCRLNLQVWDNDTFSKHDFLGSLTLDISKLQRGAKTAKACNLSLLDVDTPTMNLFKVRRTKGWWPFKTIDLNSQQETFAGSVELEFELLSKEDAIKFPAGLGREEPQALPKPRRPDTSFSWVRNPLKAFKLSRHSRV